MGERPEKYTLDRLDVDGNYTKENCKWSSRKEQSNNRRNTTYIGEYSLRDFAEKHSINSGTLFHQMKRGYCIWPRRTYIRKRD